MTPNQARLWNRMVEALRRIARALSAMSAAVTLPTAGSLVLSIAMLVMVEFSICVPNRRGQSGAP